MNPLVIPPSPNWYEASILTCAPDNTLVYGARNEIVIICDSPSDRPADVKIIPRAHSQKIISVNLNKSWGQPNKLLVTVAEDKVVKLWNVETLEKKLSHNVHKIHNKVIGVTFAGDERIISASEEGSIVIWNIGLNQTNTLKDVFGFKVIITCISTCPHANWLTAFGLKNGLVVVADLRKQGKVLYKLRGHDKSVLSLAWCPAPINIFPKDPHNYVGPKKDQSTSKNFTEPVNIPNADNSEIKKTNEVSEETTDGNSIKACVKEKNNAQSINKESCHQTVDIPKGSNISEIKKNIEATDESTPIKNEAKAKNKISIWTDLKHADDDEISEDYREQEKIHPLLRVYDSEDDDFLKECQKLRSRILGSDKQNNENRDCQTSVKDNEFSENKEILRRKHEESDTTTEKNVLDKEQKIVSIDDCVDEEKAADEIKSNEEENEKYERKAEENKLTTLSEKNDETSIGEVKMEIPLNVPIEEEPRKEFLLASSAREGNVYIWRAGTDGRMQTFFSVPNKSNHRKSSRSNTDKLWIILFWVTPTTLLSSSKSGELLQWTLPKPKDKNKQYRLVHHDHNTLLFSIAAPIMFLNESNWQEVDEKKLNIWTVGQDRLLLNTSLSSERTNLACYPTVGVAECFAPSPLDPSRLAIGTGEGIIKIWDLSRHHTKNIIMTNFYQKIQSKVVTLAWHPTNELLLAYGTLEGRIGYLDIGNKSKLPTLLPNFFKSQIHKIEWGPLNNNSEELGLFAVAEGKLITFNTKKLEKDPQEVDTPDNTFVYTFSWKPDYTMMLISSKSGALIVYSSDLKIFSTHYLQHKLQTICWHPAAGQVGSPAGYSHWFASTFNSKEIIVYNLIDAENIEQKIVAKYKFGDTINCLAWSPFEVNQLVVARDDGVAQIWNVESNAILSTYINPNFESVLAVTWSPIDSDYVISAGKEHTIRIWRISDSPARNDEEIADMRKNCIKERSEDSVELTQKIEKTGEEHPKVKKTNKNNLLPNFYSPKSTSQIIGDLRKLLMWKERSIDVEPQVGESELSILNIFGSNADMLKIINFNETSHKLKGKYNLKNTLSLFRGDISSAVKEAIEEKRVTPWIIMMAPMVSPKVWKMTCEVYAQQLSEETDADLVEIATFYLACHKIEEAIKVLCEGAMFREALALVKCRLPENDPLVTEIIEKWASYSLIVGNFETAAQCNIFLGKYGEAASVLFRRSDAETLKFATELAEKSGNEDLYKAVLFRYNAFKDESDGKQTNGELPSKADVISQRERKGLSETRNVTDNSENNKNCDVATSDSDKNSDSERSLEKCEKSENTGVELLRKMSTSLGTEGFKAGFEEPKEERTIKRSSSLSSNFVLSVEVTSNGEEAPRELQFKTKNGVNELLTTEEVKKLLGNTKFGSVNDGLGAGPNENPSKN